MAGFDDGLKSLDDTTMAESLSEASGSLEVLEASDEGTCLTTFFLLCSEDKDVPLSEDSKDTCLSKRKKKSKFKALKSFFGKKKKKEPEEAQTRRMLKPSLSSSNIDISSQKPAQEDQPIRPRPKSSMGSKAVSHDSIFILEPEPRRSASNLYPSTDLQKGRSLQIPPRHPCQPSTGPPFFRSATISKDFKTTSVNNDPPKSPQNKTSSQEMLTEKSFSESSSGPEHSQSSTSSTTCAGPNSAQQPLGFSTPATSQGCLDSSAARHKMALNPRKQKKKKALQTTVKPKQEEPSFPFVSEEEKNTTEPYDSDQKKLKKDSTDISSQDQNTTEVYDQKAADQDPNTDVAWSLGYPSSAASGRRRRRRGTHDCESKGRSFMQSSQGYGTGNISEPSPTDKTAKDCPLWHLPLENQAMEKLTIPQTETTPQELLPDTSDMEWRDAGIYLKAKKLSAPHPTFEDMVSDPTPHQEVGTSGAKKTEGRASLLPLVGRPSTAQDQAILSGAAEAQVLMDPSHVWSGKEEASSIGLQNAQSEMEVSQDVRTHCKENVPGNILQAFIDRVSGMISTTTEGGISTEKLSPRSLSQSSLGKSDSEDSEDSSSDSEEGSDSEEELPPGYSSRSLWEPEDVQALFPQSRRLVMERSRLEQRVIPGYSLQFLGKPEAEEVSSDSESTTEEGSDSEEPTPGHSLQSLEKLEEGRSPQVLQEPKAKGVSTESNSSEDLSSTEGDLPLGHPEKALGKPKEQPEVASVSKNTLKEWSDSVMQMPPEQPSQPIVRPTVQQQVSSSSMNISLGQRGSVEPVSRGCPFQSWRSLKFQQQYSVGSEKAAVEWGLFMEPLPPRKNAKRTMKPKLEQKVFSSAELTTMEEVVSTEALPPRHPQLLTRPIVEQEVSTGLERLVEGSTLMEPPRYPSQPSARPRVREEASLSAESAVVEGSVSMQPVPAKRHSQPLMRPFIQQQISAGPRGAAIEGSISEALSPPTHPFQPWVNPQGKQEVSLFPESAAGRSHSVELLHPKLLSQSPMNPAVHQNEFTGSESVAAEVISMDPLQSKYPSKPLSNPQGQKISENTTVGEDIWGDLQPPGYPSQPGVRPKFQPQMTLESESTSAQWSSSGKPMLVGHSFQTWVNSKFKQQFSAGAESAEAEGSLPMESVPPRHPFWSGPDPTFEQVSACPGNASAQWGISMDLPFPRMPSQPLTSVVKQPKSSGSASASTQWSSSMGPMPPTHPFQPQGNPTVKQQVSTGPESSAAEGGVSMEPRPSRYSQPLIRAQVEQEVYLAPMSASAEWGGTVGPMPPSYAYQPWVSPNFEQQVSAGPEDVAMEGSISREPLPPRNLPRPLMKQHKIQKISSSFENAPVQGGISGGSLPVKCPTPFLMGSKVQEITSRLQNAATEEDISRKLLPPRAPSQSFVKFMAQKVFSEGPANERSMYLDAVSPNHPPKPLMRPKVEHQVFADWGNTDPEGGISLNRMPVEQPSQSLVGPEDPQEDPSHVDSIPMKWSTAQGQVLAGQLAQVREKLEYRQEVASVSDSSPEDWRSSEEQLPSRQPLQALDVSESQPLILSMGSMTVPGEESHAEEHLATSHPFQAFGNAEYQQQVFSGSMNAAAEGATFESNPSSWSPPKGPAPPKKTKKPSQGLKEFMESISTSTTKPGKSLTDLDWKKPIFGDAFSKEEIVQSSDGNNDNHSDSSTNKADVKNIFGVQLRRIPSPQKLKNEKQCNLTELPSLPSGPISSSAGKEQRIASAIQRFLGTFENLSPTSDLAEKQQSWPKSEGMAKKQPAYKTPGKPPGQQSDQAISEPAWVTVAKQKQKGFQAYVPPKEPKTKSRTRAKAETKEPRYGGASPANENLLGRILTSSTHKQEKMAQMKPHKSTKSVAFEDPKILRTSAKGRETRRSASLPARLRKPVEPVQQVEPTEPIWFSMAKKKAKAWSHMAEIMQ